ncbi:MAG: glycosyltransferase family 9 protein, partial [Nitrospirota bacterium]|nr:glycosyltransferase family 9 protein [Nitrospirota bacterium]
MPQTLLLQLARLGDLIQSLPVISSLHTKFPEHVLDLLCAAPLAPLGRLFPGIQRVYPWEGEQWHSFSRISDRVDEHQLEAARVYLAGLAFPDYTLAYNLNNHPRSVLAAHLLSGRVVGAGAQGPLNPTLPPWVAYLRQVAGDRGSNRIHLADAFCGVCGLNPSPVVPTLNVQDVELASGHQQVMYDSSLMKIGIVLGAGDPDRRVPLAAWRKVIEACADHLPNYLCVLIGGAGEREAALALEDQLSPHYLSRVFNCVGRTSLPQLAHVFNQCQWVVGSDTGPLHLGVACGARAIGWYFSRARVHET